MRPAIRSAVRSAIRPAIRPAALLLVLLTAPGCPGDDSGTDSGSMASTTSSTTSTSSAEASDGAESSTGAAGSGDGPATDSSGDAADSSSSDGGPVCELPVVGEWNSCIDEAGAIDNTRCNWVGNPDGVGFLTCLSSADLEGGNVCIIRGCEDTCDCFDPPATGTAEVVCGPLLEGGENGCGLDCSDGRTCPDGMECAGNVCFWPPA